MTYTDLKIGIISHSAYKTVVLMALLRDLLLVRKDKSPLHRTTVLLVRHSEIICFVCVLKERRYINRVRLETSDMCSVGEVI
jgi:hypothetical protein